MPRISVAPVPPVETVESFTIEPVEAIVVLPAEVETVELSIEFVISVSAFSAVLNICEPFETLPEIVVLPPLVVTVELLRAFFIETVPLFEITADSVRVPVIVVEALLYISDAPETLPEIVVVPALVVIVDPPETAPEIVVVVDEVVISDAFWIAPEIVVLSAFAVTVEPATTP